MSNLDLSGLFEKLEQDHRPDLQDLHDETDKDFLGALCREAIDHRFIMIIQNLFEAYPEPTPQQFQQALKDGNWPM